jgi:Fic family protein
MCRHSLKRTHSPYTFTRWKVFCRLPKVWLAMAIIHTFNISVLKLAHGTHFRAVVLEDTYMPRFVRRTWESGHVALGHNEPLEFEYEAYIPDPIARYAAPLPLGLAEQVEVTMRALEVLQNTAPSTGLEALGPHLLRAESVASSRIEGLVLSQRRLARAMLDPEAERDVARAVIGNIRAMEQAIRMGTEADYLALPHLLAIHQTLLEGTEGAAIAGQIRTSQNWLGGSEWTPRGAEFVPPPETEVARLLDDLFVFMGRTDVPALIQAAVAHSQFETIHPFADGNGRVGRALIHTLLLRRGVARRFVPPVSLVLAANAGRYVEGLTAFRRGDVDSWCLFFVRAMGSAAEHAAQLDGQLRALQEEWRALLGNPRRHSATAKLVAALPAQPVVDVPTAAALVGVSAEGARRALNELTAAGITQTVVIGKQRNRVWEARSLLAILDNFEWSLSESTRIGEPRRPTPRPGH